MMSFLSQEASKQGQMAHGQGCHRLALSPGCGLEELPIEIIFFPPKTLPPLPPVLGPSMPCHEHTPVPALEPSRQKDTNRNDTLGKLGWSVVHVARGCAWQEQQGGEGRARTATACPLWGLCTLGGQVPRGSGLFPGLGPPQNQTLGFEDTFSVPGWAPKSAG